MQQRNPSIALRRCTPDGRQVGTGFSIFTGDGEENSSWDQEGGQDLCY